MKVFVATKQGQGIRKNDFFYTNEGELVLFGTECDCESVDGSCGCKRSMIGMKTAKAATTFKVADLPIDQEGYFSQIRSHLKNGGWLKYLNESDVKNSGRELLRLAAQFPLDAVLEKRGRTILVRVRATKGGHHV